MHLECVKESEIHFIRNRAREMGKLHVESNTFQANHERVGSPRGNERRRGVVNRGPLPEHDSSKRN